MRSSTCLRFITACVSGLAFVAAQAQPQPVSVAGFRVYKLTGHYEYNIDGVPLLGIVTLNLPNNKVKFTTCNNKTLELDFKELNATTATCPPPKKDYGPSWTAFSKEIVPLFKADADPKGASGFHVMFQNAKLDLLMLPTDYKGHLAKAKVGDRVGFAFTDDDGKKSIAVIVTD